MSVVVDENAKARFLIHASVTSRELIARPLSMAGFTLSWEPLFAGISDAETLALGAEPQWMLATASERVGQANPWDLAHELVHSSAGMGFSTAGSEVYIEPDFLQDGCYPYSHGRAAETGLGVAEACVFHDQDAQNWPPSSKFAWHLEAEFSELKQARDLVGDVGRGESRIRIGILDTGYDDKHQARPDFILSGLERSFVDGDPPNSAVDPGIAGGLNNPGHGTGTIGLLAGRRLAKMSVTEQNTRDYLGGAPYSSIIPVRIANSVVQFYTSGMAKGLEYIISPGGDAGNRCDVVSISMGGLPSRAWAEAINKAYEAGIVVVAAAGNNIGRLTPTSIVWPARFRRVIAATGITGGYAPYKLDGFHPNVMEGNFGPQSKMATALAAYTPNTPWAKWRCAKLIDRNGAGTSSATPQIAAAAALWLQKHRPSFPAEPWKKVEAVRTALFSSAKKDIANLEEFFGQGALQAKQALNVDAGSNLIRTEPDSVSFPLLRVLTGLGLAPTLRTAMYELEALHLAQRSKELHAILPDTETTQQYQKDQLRRYVDTMIELKETSEALRTFLKKNRAYVGPASDGGAGGVGTPLPTEDGGGLAPPAGVAFRTGADIKAKKEVKASAPVSRRLRGYAFDPSLSTQLEMAVINQLTYAVPWEESIKPGPTGEYLEVIDYDPASQCFYAPVDLNERHLLAQDGLSPSEGNPQFHQQMVYAVAMTTIRNFERALGRRVLWAPQLVRDETGKVLREEYVQRLRIYPHALREANAYYSPEKKALLFGYFPADDSDPGHHYPGGTVFACLSHDIIAHETTHAILDGMHQRFVEASNPDVPAFHEAFADIVALFQHFTYPEVLKHQIARTRGDLQKQNLLGQLAQQFGQAIGNYGALRDAIGHINEQTKQWEPTEPDPQDYQQVLEPHARGAILVAAVFDAFLSIYKTRVADLLRVASHGTGILTPGEIHPDLVNRLSGEAAKSAKHVLRMCIRALDYCPTVDITFGDYLRALVTADYDLVPDDNLGYRIAVVEAFRRRGIYPRDVRTLSVDTLRWDTVTGVAQERMKGIRDCLRAFLQKFTYGDSRKALYVLMRKYRGELHRMLEFEDPAMAGLLGLDPATPVEVHSLRPTQRINPDGDPSPQIVLEITQSRHVYPKGDGAGCSPSPTTFRGGCTLILDVIAIKDEAVGDDEGSGEQATEELQIRYCIKKDIFSGARLQRQTEFIRRGVGAGLRSTYFDENKSEPFAFLHRAACRQEP
jgi:hypothetical protein